MQNQHPVRLPLIKLVLYCSVLSALFFLLDLSLPLGVAGGVPYIAVVLIALWSANIRAALVIAAFCSTLTVLGYFYSPEGGEFWVVLTNRVLALFAIWATAILIMRWKIAEQLNEQYRDRAEREKLDSAIRLEQAEKEAQQHRERLAHVDRITAMGEMAASIAHEINQPLTAIATYTEACQRLIKNNMMSESDLNSILGKIGNQAHRAGEVIRHLRTFVKKRDSLRDTADCNELVREVANLVKPEAKLHNISVVLELSPQLPPINVDPIQIQQVILNLVHNGIDSMVELVSADHSVIANEIVIKTQRISDDAVEISVKDQGIGMTEEVANRIFDPFFTTKAKGLGMGLCISRSIVDAHRGTIQVRPIETRGCLFFITLPTVVGKR